MIETTRDKLLRCGFEFMESGNCYHREKSAHRCIVEGFNTHKAYFNAIGGDIWFDDVFHLNQIYNAIFNASENWFDYPLPCPFCGDDVAMSSDPGGLGEYIACKGAIDSPPDCENRYAFYGYDKELSASQLVNEHNLVCLGVSNKKLRSEDDDKER